MSEITPTHTLGGICMRPRHEHLDPAIAYAVRRTDPVNAALANGFSTHVSTGTTPSCRPARIWAPLCCHHSWPPARCAAGPWKRSSRPSLSASRSPRALTRRLSLDPPARLAGDGSCRRCGGCRRGRANARPRAQGNRPRDRHRRIRLDVEAAQYRPRRRIRTPERASGEPRLHLARRHPRCGQVSRAVR